MIAIKKMEIREEIYLNSSEHIFDLSFSDNLMLSNYARSNNFKLCSMIGGSESLRDLQESRNLFSDAYEFQMIESVFAINKIFNALEKVFKKEKTLLNKKKIFITIASKMGLDLIEQIYSLNVPNHINKKNLIFTFDRRSIILSLGLVKNNNFELIDFESTVNNLISPKLKFINLYSYAISGGVTNKSLTNLKHFNIIPDYIKTGIFTIKSNTINKDFFNSIFSLQTLEKKLISHMNRSIIKKHNYLTIRERHLKNYLINYTS